jgi:membrane dipeptidase
MGAGGFMQNISQNLTLGAVMICSAAFLAAQSNDAALIAKAKAIHARVITLDTHNDIDPANFTADCNYKLRLTTQVNLPKMVEGGMDVSFMIVYVGQGPLTPEGYANAYKQAIAKFDAIHRLTKTIAPDNIGLALTPADVIALHQKNLRIAVIGVENGYPIGTDIGKVKEFTTAAAVICLLPTMATASLRIRTPGKRKAICTTMAFRLWAVRLSLR